MDVFLMWIAIEIGQTLCFPNTCAEVIIREATTQSEPVEPPKAEEPVEEKTDETVE